MSELRNLLNETISTLKQQRDEIALKIHLGKEDAKDEWNKVQTKLDKLSEEFEPVRDAVGESSENLLQSLKLVADEVKSSFKRIRDAM